MNSSRHVRTFGSAVRFARCQGQNRVSRSGMPERRALDRRSRRGATQRRTMDSTGPESLRKPGGQRHKHEQLPHPRVVDPCSSLTCPHVTRAATYPHGRDPQRTPRPERTSPESVRPLIGRSAHPSAADPDVSWPSRQSRTSSQSAKRSMTFPARSVTTHSPGPVGRSSSGGSGVWDGHQS